jgi:hypothetical protein
MPDCMETSRSVRGRVLMKILNILYVKPCTDKPIKIPIEAGLKSKPRKIPGKKWVRP